MGLFEKENHGRIFDYDQLKHVGYWPRNIGAGPSRNSSSLALQEANSSGQNYNFNMLLANCLLCN